MGRRNAAVPPPPVGPSRAAEYVRMSTDHQRYSIGYQRTATADYAAANGLSIVESYADEGLSGVTLQHRIQLQRLLADVISGKASYQVILVYDVSRWGRFQDADEGAHYEFLCRQAGIEIRYVAEVFPNDGSPMSSIVKSLKRLMAGEYSRELSAKVSLVHARGASQGHWQGAAAPFGLSRMVCDVVGQPGQVLARGQQKSNNGRSILVPGPTCEIDVVRRIFQMFVNDHIGPKAIAQRLSREGFLTAPGNPWTASAVDKTLRNLSYVGTYAYRKRLQIFGSSRPAMARPRHEWIIRENSFEPIIDRKLWDDAQEIFRQQRDGLTKAEAISIIQEVAKSNGSINKAALVKATPWGSKGSYPALFGSVVEAYQEAGVGTKVRLAHIAAANLSARMNTQLFTELMTALADAGIEYTRIIRNPRVRLDDGREISVSIVRPTSCPDYRQCIWTRFIHRSKRPSILLLGCRSHDPLGVIRYLVMRSEEMTAETIFVAVGSRSRYWQYEVPDVASAFARIVELVGS